MLHILLNVDEKCFMGVLFVLICFMMLGTEPRNSHILGKNYLTKNNTTLYNLEDTSSRLL